MNWTIVLVVSLGLSLDRIVDTTVVNKSLVVLESLARSLDGRPMWAKRTNAYIGVLVRTWGERSGAWNYTWRRTHWECDQQHPGIGLRKACGTPGCGRARRVSGVWTSGGQGLYGTVRRQSLASHRLICMDLICTHSLI